MKKLCIYLFLVLFSFQTPSQADDIRDFQIEGMSLGDSLLNYFSKSEIEKAHKIFYPASKKFTQIAPDEPIKGYELYEVVSFTFKSNDNNYKIYQLKGMMGYDNKIDECLKEKDKILKEVSNVLKNFEERKYTNNFAGAAGESIAYVTDFNIPSGSIRVWCSNWDENTEKEKGWIDSLNVDASSKEYLNWLNNEAY